MSIESMKEIDDELKREKQTIRILEMIAQDMADDAKNFDGKEFNRRNVATYFGNHGAAIAVLAKIFKQHIIETKEQ